MTRTALFVSTLLVSPVAAGDWPGWRGQNRDALSHEAGLLQEWPASGPPLAWKAIGMGAGFSGVAVAGNHLFTIGDRSGAQRVIALDRRDGLEVWSARIGPPWNDEYGGGRGTPTVDGDLLFALGTDGDLVCLEIATGKERWRKNLARDFGGAVMTGWKWS